MQEQLTKSVGAGISVEWFESLAARRRIAALANMATGIRLRIRETFDIHRRILDWARLLSPDGIPARASGRRRDDPEGHALVDGGLQRLDFGNRMGSTMFAGLQMDLLPGLFSAAISRFACPGKRGVTRG